MMRLYLAVFLLVASASLKAATLFIEGGLHFGGDDIATVTFVGGDTETITAGELLSASIGLIADINESAEVRASFGIKLDGVFADNGDVEFTRFPLEVMAFTKGEEVSFGAGVSYHLAPEFSASGPFVGGDIEFKDALGLVVEVDYRLGERGYIGLKGTFIDYEVDSAFASGDIDGNSVGIVIGARFK